MGRGDALGNHAEPRRVRHVLFVLSIEHGFLTKVLQTVAAWVLRPRVTVSAPPSLAGERKPLVVTDKNPRTGGERNALDGARVPRSESRHGNHRGGDRHRLSGETATVLHNGKSHDVELVNLSRGGAMIRCGFVPRLWDIVELRLGEGLGLDAAVRWIKGDAHWPGVRARNEDRLLSRAERAALLLEVIQRSFPDQSVSLEAGHADRARRRAGGRGSRQPRPEASPPDLEGRNPLRA